MNKNIEEKKKVKTRSEGIKLEEAGALGVGDRRWSVTGGAMQALVACLLLGHHERGELRESDLETCICVAFRFCIFLYDDMYTIGWLVAAPAAEATGRISPRARYHR